MKRLTQKEFEGRVQASVKARMIFAPLTKNVTEAFAIYQDVLAEEERAVFITGLNKPEESALFMEKYKRPKCPKCGKDMLLRTGLDRICDKSNKMRWKTCWMCPDSIKETGCYHEEYSRKSVCEWMKELEKVEEDNAKI